MVERRRVRPRLLIDSILVLACCWVAPAVLAQPDFLWVERIGGPDWEWAWGVATDAAGNVLVTGSFGSRAELGGATLVGAGGTDVLVAKYAPDGTLLWARSAGGSDPPESRLGGRHWTARTDTGSGIAADAAGNVYVTGGFVGIARFGPSSIESAGSVDAFLAKYSPSGSLRWVIGFGGAGRDEGFAVTTAPGGDVFVAGIFSGTATVSGRRLASRGGQDIFVARFTPGGELVWVEQAGGSGLDDAIDLTLTDAGDVVVTGNVSGNAAFGGVSVTAAGSTDGFVATYRADGSVAGVSRLGGNLLEDTLGVAGRDPSNVFVTGYFDVSTEIDRRTFRTGGLSTFIVQADLPADRFGWVRILLDSDLEGFNDVRSSGIDLDAEGEVVTTGYFTGNLDVGGELLLVSGDSEDTEAFVARHLASDGSLSWAKRAGGPGRDSGTDVATDGAGNVYAVGIFQGTADFGTLSLPVVAYDDSFVAKIGVPPPPPEPVSGDRFEPSDTLDEATSLSGWEHLHELCPPLVRRALRDPDLRCPGVWEDGPAPRGAEEVWRLTIADLSIHDLADVNFYGVRLPDPQSAADGGPHDIRTREDIIRGNAFEPLPECGFAQRTELGPDGRNNLIYVTAGGTLTIEVVPTANSLSDRPVSTPGESLRLYSGGAPLTAAGTPLRKTIPCPRSRAGLRDLAFSFGERATPRTDIVQLGGYELRLEYTIEIERAIPQWALDESERGGLRPLPCPGLGRFPLCDLDAFDFEHPLRPDCIADGPGCFELFTFDWPAAEQPLELFFTVQGSVSFELLDEAGDVIAKTEPVPSATPTTQALASAVTRGELPRSFPAEAGPFEELRLEAAQLGEGRYFLRVSGEGGHYSLSYRQPVEPPAAEAGGAAGRKSFLIPLVLLALAVGLVVVVLWVRSLQPRL